MKHLDLFSGIGGFALASSWVWGDEYENVGHSEVEPYACKVYHSHFESECLGDITKIKWKEGQADLITGGFPCQPHSVAGKRKASEDERDLWGECVRAVRGVRPRYALFENVPGLLTSERGRFFNRVLSDLAAIGYDAEWTIISAASLGAEHLRERLWIVAYPDGARLEGGGDRGADEDDAFIFSSRHRPLVGTEVEGLGKLGASRWSRNTNGIPSRVDRLKGLGNSIVPQCAEVILRRLRENGL